MIFCLGNECWWACRNANSDRKAIEKELNLPVPEALAKKIQWAKGAQYCREHPEKLQHHFPYPDMQCFTALVKEETEIAMCQS